MASTAMPPRRIFRPLLLFLTWLAGAIASLLFHPADPVLDHDEIYWIGSTYYYDLAFVQRDWRHPDWQLQPARENPPGAKYVLGFGLATSGHRITNLDNLAYFYLHWLGWQNDLGAQTAEPERMKRARVIASASPGFRAWATEQGHAPVTRPIVYAARRTNLVCVLLASVLLGVIGYQVGHAVTGLLAGLLLLFHPIAMEVATHAMADPAALLFSVVAAGTTLRWYLRVSGWTGTGWSPVAGPTVVVGLALALTCATKMSGLVLAFVAGALVLERMVAASAGRDFVRAGKIATLGLLILAVAVAGFCAINPTILQDFPGGFMAPVTDISQGLAIQVDLKQSSPTSLAEKFEAVATMAFFGWSGMLAMAGVALWALLRKSRDPVTTFFVVWWAIAFVCVTAWLPFAWPRYTLPMLAPSAWLVGAFATDLGREWVASRRTRAASPMSVAG